VSQQTTNRSFDELASGLASGSISRGKALKLMGAALLGGTLASLGIGEAAGDPPGCKRDGKKCKRDTQCCSENCVNGVCGGEECPPDRIVTPVGGGDPFCACSLNCAASCDDCLLIPGAICVTATFCSEDSFICAIPC
jgi:hypothetical protein